MSNRAAVMTALNEIKIQERPIPTPGPREAVVRIEAVGVCGSDHSYFVRGRIGDYIVNGPIVLGHETSGVVETVGSEVTNVAPGDRVAIEPGTPCRNCRECRMGRYHLCPDLVFLATPPYDGALLEHMLIDSRNLFPIPDSMTFEQAALLEPLSVGIWACKRANLAPGDDVLVTGAGPVGLVSASAARAFGARTVTITDVSDFRLGLAKSMGFTTERSDAPSDADFDVLIECSGAPGVLASGMRRLRPAGRAAMVGMSKEDLIGLPLAQLNPNELTLGTVNRYNNTWPIAIELVASGRVDVKPLITHRFTLDQTAEALTIGERVADSIKAIIHPQQH
jgi:L-iditol 2-dehydrogenase